MGAALLPNSSTPWEQAMADAMAVSEIVHSGIGAMRRVKYVSPRPSMLPYLVWEYGLGELTPYVPNLYNLIDQGVRWQRLRGTVSAVAIGLAWIGYTASIEEAWTGRRWWNSFQLRFAMLPMQDSPDLERIEAITGLSVPKRSMLRRGVHQYDVGPVEADHSPLDGAMPDHESGIAVTPANTVWSFGRCHEASHTMTEAEGMAIGNWLEPSEDDGLLWVDLDVLWVGADVLWADNPVQQRQAILAGWFSGKPLYLRISSAAGVVGYRRCRSVRPVAPQFGGAYTVDAERYEPTTGAGLLYVEAMSQFDDADGVVCTSLSLIVNAVLADDIDPGQLWLEPEDLLGGDAIATQSVSIPLRRTVREQVKILMRF